ncbi:MAG: hypothetical protein F6K40_16945 [Okeania sp. SIO3I5]|uniref:hypothetical protein n=1 Tax=Okeania sp. SIO3I5 TaxID=2607805 RepID=UPI0013B69406|nr:hypothetical protein [Okeania sp. SIO3I5]NEQ37856.1 hypothetical protein [Okeania sp. SIO3I5]
MSEYNFLEFSQKERGFFNKAKYQNLSDDEISMLVDKYLEYLDFFVGLDERIKLVPITILWHEKIKCSRLRMPPIYEKVKQFSMLDVELFLKSKFDFVDRFGVLHPEAVKRIIAIL